MWRDAAEDDNGSGRVANLEVRWSLQQRLRRLRPRRHGLGDSAAKRMAAHGLGDHGGGREIDAGQRQQLCCGVGVEEDVAGRRGATTELLFLLFLFVQSSS
ncbi:hypothetical protein M0R45_016414 [Rubus argutus]|uniref:Uncharacterized protein n=1 Tax=Rubus argutus TaxID=59490 RepID=A0AAW1XSH4_RUBAR